MICPLCSSPDLTSWSEDKHRSYYFCKECSLISVPRNELIAVESEVDRYKAHENNENDPHYRHYLSQIAEAITPYLKAGQIGLDFGCGKTTLLENIFVEQGYEVVSY